MSIAIHRAPAALLLAASFALAQPALAPPALAQPASAPQKKTAAAPRHGSGAAIPHAIGHYQDWVAAVHPESGQPVCYAFTRATASNPALQGRGDVVLTVTERGRSRDTVAISAGFAYAANASVRVDVEPASFQFYTAQRSAFARDGHAAVLAFVRGRQVTVRNPGPKGATVTDEFSLRGFTAAYNAIQKACPPGRAAAT